MKVRERTDQVPGGNFNNADRTPNRTASEAVVQKLADLYVRMGAAA
jgi:hypothetical protein